MSELLPVSASAVAAAALGAAAVAACCQRDGAAAAADDESRECQQERRMVRFGPGSASVAFGDSPDCGLQRLRSSAGAFAAGDTAAIARNFASDGYVYLPGALDRDEVLAAKELVLHDFASRGDVLMPDKPIKEAVLKEGCAAGCVPFLEGRNGVTHSDAMLKVLEGERIRVAVASVLGTKDVKTFDYKWLRAVAPGQFSGAHVDWVYMGGGSEQLLTCWVPVGDIPVEMGTLAVCKGSHRLPSFAKLGATYGKLDWEKVRSPLISIRFSIEKTSFQGQIPIISAYFNRKSRKCTGRRCGLY